MEDSFFNITGAYEQDKDEKKNQTIIMFGKKTKELMNANKCKFARFSLHSSSLKTNPTDNESIISDISSKFKAHSFLLDLPPLIFTLGKLKLFFKENLNIHLGSKDSFCVQGNHLALMILSPNKKHLDELSENISLRILNLIRLSYGIAAAGPAIYKSTYDLEEEKTSFSTKQRVFIEEGGAGLDPSSYQNFIDHDSEKISDFILTPDAELLFKHAVSERHTKTRFLFLWLCLDSMFDGKSREKIFRNILQSEIINQEVFRLFKIRCKLAHEGNAEITMQDCTSVLWAIRTAASPIISAKIKSASAYEAWIKAEQL